MKLEMKENEIINNTGIMYATQLETIRQLNKFDSDLAAEFAIACFELALTGEISTDNVLVMPMLNSYAALNEKTNEKKRAKEEFNKKKQIENLQLDEIALLYNNGFKQREIAEKLDLSERVVSYRMGVIKSDYQELLVEEDEI